jgi:hypothetical protein
MKQDDPDSMVLEKDKCMDEWNKTESPDHLWAADL